MFEVGGSGKGFSQIKDVPDSYVVADENAVRGMLEECQKRRPQVESMVRGSLLSDEAKKEYLRIFTDRLAMFRYLF